MLTNLPAVDRKELLEPGVMNAVLAAAERARPAARGALALARAGNLGPAALEALSTGDQTTAAFLRGVDFFSQGLMDRSIQQLQISMQQAPTFAPARLFLGAALASGKIATRRARTDFFIEISFRLAGDDRRSRNDRDEAMQFTIRQRIK